MGTQDVISTINLSLWRALRIPCLFNLIPYCPCHSSARKTFFLSGIMCTLFKLQTGTQSQRFSDLIIFDFAISKYLVHAPSNWLF